jgi:hypothetical protein
MVAPVPSRCQLPSIAGSVPETVSAGVRDNPHQSSIDAHLAPRLAAAEANRRSQPEIPGLAAVGGAAAGQAAYEVLSGFQVLVTYLQHDLTTPLSKPRHATATLAGGARLRFGSGRVEPETPPRTWDNQILPDRLGSFVHSYA